MSIINPWLSDRVVTAAVLFLTICNGYKFKQKVLVITYTLLHRQKDTVAEVQFFQAFKITQTKQVFHGAVLFAIRCKSTV